MSRIEARHRMWREKTRNMGRGTLRKDRGSPAKINQTSTIHGEEALMSYRIAKQKMVEKANARNRADYPQIYLTPGTLVLLINEGKGTFGADEDTEYFTLERGNSQVEVASSNRAILAMTLKDIRLINIRWLLKNPAEK